MTTAKVEPKEEPPVQSKTKQATTPVKIAQHEQQEDVQMKSADNKKLVKSDVEEDDEEVLPKKKGRLIKNSTASKKQFSEDEEEFKPMVKKRVQIDSDSEMMGEEGADQENKNIPNAPQPVTSGPAKGRRKVKKSRTYQKDGYFVTSDYSSYEEYDLPPASQVVKKDGVKKVMQHNLVQPSTTNKTKVEPAKPGQKSQSQLMSFFKK